jgi:hypothetical protein
VDLVEMDIADAGVVEAIAELRPERYVERRDGGGDDEHPRPPARGRSR